MSAHDPAAVFRCHESRVRSYCRDFPVVFDQADGHHLYDTSGRRYVDLLSGAGSLNYGHNPAPIVAAVTDYLRSGGPVQSLDLHTTAKAAFLTSFHERILTPRGMGDHVMQFPGPAGTLAVEAALKLARKVTGRRTVVAFEGAFHGASLGALAATTSPVLRGAAGVPLPGVRFLPYGDGDAPGDPAGALADALLGPGSARVEPPAAILLETVQGEGGLNAATGTFLSRVREVADRVGALVIVDDIQAGCGRTGRFFSFEHVPGLDPDIVCLSKSLSGMGLPLAMLLIRRDRDGWAPGEHNGTFRGHNLAFVAATAALDYWSDPGFRTGLSQLEVAIGFALRSVLAALPPGAARLAGRGAMSGLRFTHAGTAERVRAGLFRAGVIAETSGGGRVLKLFPPLTMPVDEWRRVADRIGEVVVDAVGIAGSHRGVGVPGAQKVGEVA